MCSKKTVQIAEMFCLDKVNIIPVEDKVISHMHAAYVHKGTNAVLQRLTAINLYITNALMYYSEEDIWRDRCGTMLETLKEKTFKCSEDYPIQRPNVPKKNVKISIPERSVLISTSSVSSKSILYSDWIKVVDFFNKNQYHVFFNCQSETEDVLPGTNKIVLDMISIYNIIDHFDVVIGLRSGFQDFIVDRAIKIVSINSGNMYPNFTLTQWGIGADVREFKYKKETFLEDIINNVHDLRI